jgi:PAS domain S-box-containing protein
LVQRGLRLEELSKQYRQLKKSLQQSEDRFLKLFNLCSAPLLITTAREGHVLDANTAFVRFLGYSRNELIGRTTTECGICIHPERRSQYAQMVQKGAVHNFEEQLRSRSGEIWNVFLTADSLSVSDEVCILSMAVLRNLFCNAVPIGSPHIPIY